MKMKDAIVVEEQEFVEICSLFEATCAKLKVQDDIPNTGTPARTIWREAIKSAHFVIRGQFVVWARKQGVRID